MNAYSEDLVAVGDVGPAEPCELSASGFLGMGGALRATTEGFEDMLDAIEEPDGL